MKQVIIIAEAGVNHNGDMTLAKKLIRSAKLIKADYVKFQSFITEENISSLAPKAGYQTETTESGESQFDMLKRLELNLEETIELKEYSDKKGIGFMTTPAESQNVKLVKNLGLDFIKIASESITNFPLLALIGKLKQKIIMSTGMATIKEIEGALNILMKQGMNQKNIILLHCNSEYPSPFSDLNLRAMETLKSTFGVEVGLSDHSSGVEASVAAVALGASVIEKHFTLDNSLEGPDHGSSLNPKNFRKLISMIRNVEKALGTGEKIPSPSERRNIVIMRRSLVARVPIKRGEKFTEKNMAAKRPGTGLSPMMWDSIFGTTAKKDYKIDDFLELL